MFKIYFIRNTSNVILYIYIGINSVNLIKVLLSLENYNL